MPSNRNEDIEATRSRILKEVLETTNKPRFCYMGYAPPLCIGDDSTSTNVRRRTTEPEKTMLVAYPKKGNGPDALFSSPRPLCIGDTYVDEWKRRLKKSSSDVKSTDDRPRFRPAGACTFTPIEYIEQKTDICDAKALYAKHKGKEPIKNFVASAPGGLFTPVYEYIGTDYYAERKFRSAEEAALKKKMGDVPPFKCAKGFSKLFSDYGKPSTAPLPPPAQVEVSKPQTRAVSTSDSGRQPFRPAGGKLESQYPEYMTNQPLEKRPVRQRSSDRENARPAWRAAPVPVWSCPTGSIALRSSNLKTEFPHVFN